MPKHGHRSRSWNLRTTLGACLLVLLQSPLVSGQDARLNVDLAAASPRVRRNAPVTLLLKAYWNGASIAEGRFEVRYFADGQRLTSETVSHDVVLTPGEQTIRVNLPTAGSIVSFAQDEIHLKFVTEKESFDLKRYPLPFNNCFRTMNVCIVGPTDRGPTTDVETDITDSLRCGDLLASSQLSRGSVSTVFDRWDNVDVPESALHFCSFDLVVLRPEGLADLRQKQTAALLQWVRAGGSVAVLLSKNVSGHHIEFLNQLVRESHTNPFVLNTDGTLVSDESTTANGIWTAHCELGRAVIVDLDLVPNDPDELWTAWRVPAGFLWKLRKERQDRLAGLSSRQWQRLRETFGQTTGRVRSQQVVWQPLGSVGRFVSQLMPEDVRVVPMGLIALILFGYLLMIGPLDYFFLGYLKRRRYTWITFPLITLFVAFLCIWLSEYYLSSRNTGRKVVVQDIGADGSVLRASRYEMTFLSRRAEVTSEVKNALFTPLDSDRLNVNAGYYYYQYPGQPGSANLRPALYQGRMPADYSVSQVVPQWKPQINRWLEIAPEGDSLSDFPWGNASLLRHHSEEALKQAIQRKWPDAKSVVFREGGERVRITGWGDVFQRPRENVNSPYIRRIPHHSSEAFEDEMTHRPRQGFFEFVSQLSPNGGDNFEDLTLLDDSDPSQAVLMIAVEEKDTLFVYRRLYTKMNDER